jgi:hypothetical protein
MTGFSRRWGLFRLSEQQPNYQWNQSETQQRQQEPFLHFTENILFKGSRMSTPRPTPPHGALGQLSNRTALSEAADRTMRPALEVPLPKSERPAEPHKFTKGVHVPTPGPTPPHGALGQVSNRASVTTSPGRTNQARPEVALPKSELTPRSHKADHRRDKRK